MPIPTIKQTPKLMNGAEAMAVAFQLAGVRIAYGYPITPQIEVIEHLARQAQITYIQADSEYNVLAGAEGVLWGGERCAVATASQGLVLMSEVMWEVSGNRLPLVMGVFNRGLKGPGWCLGDQQNDSLSMRDTGWLQFYCETAQEVLDLILLAYRVAETLLLPAMVIGDGFYVSHEKEEVWVPDAQGVREFVGDPPRRDLPRVGEPANFGALVPPSKYFALYRRMHNDLRRAIPVFETVAGEFKDRFGRCYQVLEPYALEEAETLLITAGSLSGTAREVVETLRKQGEKVGLIKIRCFRPFPYQHLRELVAPAQKIIVMERDLAPGQGGIFAGEIKMALYGAAFSSNLPLYNFVCGLGGLDVGPEIVEQAIQYAQTHPPIEGPLFLTEEEIIPEGN